MIPLNWYVPAGVLESIYYMVVIWVCWRFNRDLHRNPFKNSRREIYVRSSTTGWKGWAKIRR